jgi:NADPH:quinone reductase-like Zn-dependent oxidoreductase
MIFATMLNTTLIKVHSPAIIQSEYGTADEWKIGTSATPEFAANEVLLHVWAASIDRGTWHLMRGKPYLLRLAFGWRRPKNPIPGLAAAGVVIAVGSAVTRFKPGDEVYGIAMGSLAEVTVAKEEKLSAKPASLSFRQAAAVPVSAATAFQALHRLGKVRAGQRVLITGASGGVGSFAVQIAKAAGAVVVAVCSAEKTEVVMALGADETIDYRTEDYADGSRTYDVILDLVSTASMSRLRKSLGSNGTLVVGGMEDGSSFAGGISRQLRAVALSPFVKQKLVMLVTSEHHDSLDQLTMLFDEGKMKPLIDSVFTLTEATDAMRRLESGKVTGKVVIKLA